MRRSLIFLTSLLAVGALPDVSVARSQKESVIASGKRLYNQSGCAACHGLEGQGSAAGPRLVEKSGSPEAFIRQTRRPISEMPAYSAKVLSDKELASIQAYIRSIPASPSAKDLKLLRR